jgi:hypothetical protein
LTQDTRCLANPLRLLESTEHASGVKHPFDTGVHLFLFDKLPPVGLRDAFPHGGAKTRILFKQAHDLILYQPLAVCTGIGWRFAIAALPAPG